jgi:hypothetical protein
MSNGAMVYYHIMQWPGFKRNDGTTLTKYYYYYSFIQ